MEFLEPLARLLGISAGQLMAIAIVGAVLVVGWYVLRAALKMAVRVFTLGCLTILVLVVGLYVVLVLAR